MSKIFAQQCVCVCVYTVYCIWMHTYFHSITSNRGPKIMQAFSFKLYSLQAVVQIIYKQLKFIVYSPPNILLLVFTGPLYRWTPKPSNTKNVLKNPEILRAASSQIIQSPSLKELIHKGRNLSWVHMHVKIDSTVMTVTTSRDCIMTQQKDVLLAARL